MTTFPDTQRKGVRQPCDAKGGSQGMQFSLKGVDNTLRVPLRHLTRTPEEHSCSVKVDAFETPKGRQQHPRNFCGVLNDITPLTVLKGNSRVCSIALTLLTVFYFFLELFIGHRSTGGGEGIIIGKGILRSLTSQFRQSGKTS